jgi:plastocyanin
MLALLPPAGADPHAGHGPVVVNIGSLQYSPTSVTVFAGDIVAWSWQGPDTNHTVTSDPDQPIAFDSDPDKSPDQVGHQVGDGWSFEFDRTGTFTYHCKVHSFMQGTITVQLPPSPAPPAPVAPVLTNVRVTPTHLCRSRPRCAHAHTTVTFSVSEPASMLATIRRIAGTRPTGPAIKEVDFAGPPGANRHTLDFGRLRRGRYQLRIVAVDLSSGLRSKPALAAISVGR